jgi:HKD family nuclease
MDNQATARKTRVLCTSQALAAEFKRCCEEFSHLHIAVAWCSDPQQAPVFKFLKTFGNKLTATIGVALAHTHPDAIEWFRDAGADVRIVRDEILFFHPKAYLFSDVTRYAAFVGSSNLTHGGFHGNVEVNTLIQGTFEAEKGQDIRRLQQTLLQWHSPDYSFAPTDEWLARYREDYLAAARRAVDAMILTTPNREEGAASAGWLGTADWNMFYRRVLEGLRQNGRKASEYHNVLDIAAKELPIPWSTTNFDDAEKRKIMGGMAEYGWLGHVAAAGRLRGLMANGSEQEKQIIVDAVNGIAELQHPLDWDTLEDQLNRLTGLDLTMKVWGRFLCLVRPDLYCTVASESVRANLSETLQVGQSAFVDPRGYIQLLRLVHSSPWFQSGKPSDPAEAAVWQRRVAFMDAIFY